MRTFEYPTGVHQKLTRFANEVIAILARLIAYVGILALLFISGVHLWDQLPAGDASEPAKPDWSLATRSYPAFAVSQSDSSARTEAYEIFRHPEGGRKDVLRWSAPGEKPVAELEIYRPGDESSDLRSSDTGIVAGIDPSGIHELEAAGLIDSKFGQVTLLRLTSDPNGARACLGFVKRFEELPLRISGWSCQGDTIPARRSAIGCILNRLVLLTSGKDPKLAELFARAELKRGSCGAAAVSTASADWLTGAENPVLRGQF